MALYLKDESTFELEITKYNIDDFSAERKKEGYLCTLEGNFFLASLFVCLFLGLGYDKSGMDLTLA